jgi:GDP-L-fucose synthase
MEKHSKIFVAGHRGLVGSAIVRRLQDYGYSNIVTVSRDQLDLTKQPDVEQWFDVQRPDYVFLAAAKVNGIGSDLYGDIILENLQIQTNVIDSARRNGCKKLLFPGSNCAYPKFSRLPITEDQLLDGKLEPTSEAYSVAKIAGLKLCEYLNYQYGFNAITVMPCNIYGPNDNYDEAVSHVMAALIKKFVTATTNNDPTITLWGDGSALREFLYSDDLADALITCMLKHNDPIPVNIASGIDIPLKELAELMKTATGYTGKIVWDTTKPTGTPKKGLEISKILNMGWQPEHSITEGIALTIESYKQTELK